MLYLPAEVRIECYFQAPGLYNLSSPVGWCVWWNPLPGWEQAVSLQHQHVIFEWRISVCVSHGRGLVGARSIFILTRTLLHQGFWSLPYKVYRPSWISSRDAAMCPLSSAFVVSLHWRWRQNTPWQVYLSNNKKSLFLCRSSGAMEKLLKDLFAGCGQSVELVK